MFLTNLISTALLCAGPALAVYTIPAHLPDGTYNVHFPIDSSNNSALDFKNPIVRRVPGRIPPHNQVPKEFQTPSDADLSRLKPPLRDDLMYLYTHASHEERTKEYPLTVSDHDCNYNMRPMNRDDWNQARHYMYEYCDKFLVPARTRHITVSKHGTAAAYVCNYSKELRVCSKPEFQWAEFHWLDMRCGEFRPGWVEMSKQKKIYGRAHVGMSICSKHSRLHDAVWDYEHLAYFLGEDRLH
ncbi:hypothetical protein VHEMI09605 [[Torrubiella] hemipterigena]|uniref:Secreted protein n=1 Tax=[Torrubiella] hemipterigena TaxID=1531966 RepID=A0A0A1TGR0_9HYPO|nr:hypothetical protein VHEMI09605 [[Torrubiella] hemipterigena]